MALNSAFMHTLVFFVLAIGICFSYEPYYWDYQLRETKSPEQKEARLQSILVECPACTFEPSSSGDYPYSESECDSMNVRINGVRYKNCTLGAYISERCGGRLDCYKGLNEKCSENEITGHNFMQKCKEKSFTCMAGKCVENENVSIRGFFIKGMREGKIIMVPRVQNRYIPMLG